MKVRAWEYDICSCTGPMVTVRNTLRAYGEKGWELCSVVNLPIGSVIGDKNTILTEQTRVFYFKRESVE